MATATINNQSPDQAHTVQMRWTGSSYVAVLQQAPVPPSPWNPHLQPYQPQQTYGAAGQPVMGQPVMGQPVQPMLSYSTGAPVTSVPTYTPPPAANASRNDPPAIWPTPSVRRVTAETQSANRPTGFAGRIHWKPDNSSDSCKVCRKNFLWYWRRRHHCRQCGELVCWQCSGHKMATFIPGCETVGRVRVCSLCVLKRQSEDFSWERELAGYFGVEVARRGAQLLSHHHTWNRQNSVVRGVRVTVHHFSDERDEQNDTTDAGMEAAQLGKPSAARPTKSQAAFWVRQTTQSHAHFANPRTASQAKRGEEPTAGDAVMDAGECPICQFELTEPSGTTDYQLPRNCDPAHSLGTDPDAIVTINQCGHNFHAACLGKWLKDHTTCPMCRENAFKNVKGK